MGTEGEDTYKRERGQAGRKRNLSNSRMKFIAVDESRQYNNVKSTLFIIGSLNAN